MENGKSFWTIKTELAAARSATDGTSTIPTSRTSHDLRVQAAPRLVIRAVRQHCSENANELAELRGINERAIMQKARVGARALFLGRFLGARRKHGSEQQTRCEDVTSPARAGCDGRRSCLFDSVGLHFASRPCSLTTQPRLDQDPSHLFVVMVMM